MGWKRLPRAALPLALITVLSGCQSTTPPADGPGSAATTTAQDAPTKAADGTAEETDGAPATTRPAEPDSTDDPGPKVLLLMEENSDTGDVLAPGAAPYLNSVLALGATITAMDAGYPSECPSLPAYLLLTSGSTHGICDDGDPEVHPVDGPSIFSEVAATGRHWRVYAESMDVPCRMSDTPDGRYLVRHTAAAYYTSERERCRRWQVPMGTPQTGALKDAVDTGLPAFSLVVPDRCNDMHGGDPCLGDRVTAGDRWLQRWLPQILAGPDYRAGDLMVIITWDEAASQRVNAIPTVVLHPDLAGATVTDPRDHCSTLRTMTDRLDLQPLGCARDADPLVPQPPG